MEPVPRMELFGNGTSLVVLNTIGDEGKEVYGELRRITDASFTLAAIGVPDWNRDLSPWESPAVFGDEPFGGGADGYLRTLTDVCIPQAVSAMRGVGLPSRASFVVPLNEKVPSMLMS